MRTQYRRFKKNTPLRRFANPSVVRSVKRLEVLIGNVQRILLPVLHRSKYRAVCHFGMQKTGSVWFREMFSDKRLYKYSGLKFVDCAGRREGLQVEQGLYAPIRFVTDENMKIFDEDDVMKVVVIRDPLALLVSWVNSTENYHVSGGEDLGMSDRREKLAQLDFDGKIRFALGHFVSEDRFRKVAQLISAANATDTAIVVRYEDCLDSPIEVFGEIFAKADISLPIEELTAFVHEHSFESYSGRRMGSGAPKHSALQGGTRATVEELSPETRAMVLRLVPSELREAYGA